MPMSAPARELAPRPDPFAQLNEQQRSAVEHGLDAAAPPGSAGPLLVIAGAGTGKTMTLAARVARLVLAGADPQRILLLTFSRRAAQEMQRRVGRLLHQALGFGPTQSAPQLHWAGTFHGIGARLLREYAPQIGLAENFTIQDRGDSEDLIGLARHELKLGDTKARFPLKATCLAIYSRVLNSRQPLPEVLRTVYPWCDAWEDELKQLFRAYVAEKQTQCVLDYDDLLLYWSQMLAEPALARHVAARFDHVLVDEYQDTNRLQAAILHATQARWPRPDGGRRRRAGHLLLPRRRGAQHPRASRPVHAAGARRHAGAQLPLDAGHPRRLERRDRAVAAALRQATVERCRLGAAAVAGQRARRSRPRPRGSPTECCATANRASR